MRKSESAGLSRPGRFTSAGAAGAGVGFVQPRTVRLATNTNSPNAVLLRILVSSKNGTCLWKLLTALYIPNRVHFPTRRDGFFGGTVSEPSPHDKRPDFTFRT